MEKASSESRESNGWEALAETVQAKWETLEGEYLKDAAELSLHGLARFYYGEPIFKLARGGERVEDERLHTDVAEMELENPVMVGAGWDKKGWAVDGLYALGFAGVEVGSVLENPQPGNSRPRLWTDRETHSVGLNKLGFNSPGMEAVAEYLEDQHRPGVTGISIGKNKNVADKDAPEAHAAVARRLHEYADYLVINVASPNTPGLRNLLEREPLREIIQCTQEALDGQEDTPLFVKTTVDLSREDMDKVIEVCDKEGVAGIIDTNTTIDEKTKNRYGWNEQPGGLSGNDPDYRRRATERMRYITRSTRETELQRIGVGGINNAESALERIRAGAQAVQVVTAIRQYKGRTAQMINRGILEEIDRTQAQSVMDFIGQDT